MTASFLWGHRLFHLGLLRCAALLVPAEQRAEWQREWRGELWHVRQACATLGTHTWQSERDVTAFCLGAFQDALCLRRAGRVQNPPFATMNGSARQCLLILAVFLAVSYALALLLPGVRAERSLWQRKVNPNLVLIEQEGSNSNERPTIPASQFRSWEQRKQPYFDGLAFYRVTREPVEREFEPSGAQDRAAQGNTWGVAHASSNLFTLLGLPIRFADPDASPGDDLSEVILSETAWKREFGADPHVAGSVVRLGAQEARIAGVAPDGALGLPGRVDAWLLEPDAALMPSGAEYGDAEHGGAGYGGSGYVVAHLTEIGREEMWTACVHITANAPNDSEDDLLALSLDASKPGPGTLYLFAAFLALLALPAITTVSLGEGSMNPQKTSWLKRLHRWSFLSAKIALLLPIIYLVSLDLAYGCTGLGQEGAAYLQLVSTFGLCLFGLRWVLKDQRQRCPVCMRKVTHPAQVGVASRTFLDWNGTEMMCMGGHTLLHVPSLPTSWFGAQRWLYLDTSWGFLFAGSTRPIP
jgi:hypothetical protein